MRPPIEIQVAHVVVRAVRRVVPLTHPAVARWLWARLRRAFPEALAVVLMPNHIHVLVHAKSAAEARKRLGAVISALRRSKNVGAANLWEPVSCRELVSEPAKIARHVRYIVLNPCRAGLVRCPLEWLWSTHRDVMGAVVDPWVTRARMAAALGQSARGFRARHHRYVSADPSARVDGTPVPRAHDGDASCYSLGGAKLAALAGVRGEVSDVCVAGMARRQLMALARPARWSVASLGEVCALNVQTVRNYLRRAKPIEAATLVCLGDARLTAYLL